MKENFNNNMSTAEVKKLNEKKFESFKEKRIELINKLEEEIVVPSIIPSNSRRPNRYAQPNTASTLDTSLLGKKIDSKKLEELNINMDDQYLLDIGGTNNNALDLDFDLFDDKDLHLKSDNNKNLGAEENHLHSEFMNINPDNDKKTNFYFNNNGNIQLDNNYKEGKQSKDSKESRINFDNINININTDNNCKNQVQINDYTVFNDYNVIENNDDYFFNEPKVQENLNQKNQNYNVVNNDNLNDSVIPTSFNLEVNESKSKKKDLDISQNSNKMNNSYREDETDSSNEEDDMDIDSESEHSKFENAFKKNNTNQKNKNKKSKKPKKDIKEFKENDELIKNPLINDMINQKKIKKRFLNKNNEYEYYSSNSESSFFSDEEYIHEIIKDKPCKYLRLQEKYLASTKTNKSMFLESLANKSSKDVVKEEDKKEEAKKEDEENDSKPKLYKMIIKFEIIQLDNSNNLLGTFYDDDEMFLNEEKLHKIGFKTIENYILEFYGYNQTKLNEKNLANQNKQNAEFAKNEDTKVKTDGKGKVIANKWINYQSNNNNKIEFLSKEELNEFRFFKFQNATSEDNYYKTISNKKKQEIIQKYFVIKIKNRFRSYERINLKNMYNMNYYDQFVRYDKDNDVYNIEVLVDFYPFKMERKTFVNSNTSYGFSQKVLEFRDRIKNSYQTKDMNLNTYQLWIKLINDFNVFEDGRFILPESFICSDFYDKINYGKVFIERRQKDRLTLWKDKKETKKESKIVEQEQTEDGEIVIKK